VRLTSRASRKRACPAWVAAGSNGPEAGSRERGHWRRVGRGALSLAFLSLYWQRVPVVRPGFKPGTGLVRPLRRFQGVINDYVTWVGVGIACLGAALAFTIR
jgi:ribosomal protein L39E